MSSVLPQPVADTKTVRELVDMVMSGQVRIPIYQRDLKWGAEDVLALFDSIYRGYPMGSLLFHRRRAPAQVIRLGPLTINAPESSAALDVVDGQQRLVALAASMRRDSPVPPTPDDPFVVYFDAASEEFRSPDRTGEIPSTWVPLNELYDLSMLQEWVFDWAHGKDASLRRKVFDAGARIGGYKVPMYTVVVGDDDSEMLGQIFHRINNRGKSLEWPVIHDALYGHTSTGQPTTLAELADELEALRMGRFDEQDLLRCLVAFEGLDVTRSFDEHQRAKPGFLKGAVARALPTLRRVLQFLRVHGKIPHQRLVPRTAPLIVLTRLFRLHPELASRSLELLSRWLWRSILATKLYDERTFQRRGVSDIDDDEAASIKRLLSFLPATDPDTFGYPERFDARAADSRVVLLAMNSLSPRSLITGRAIDVPELIERVDRDAFRRIVSRGGGSHMSGPANRILLAGEGLARAELVEYINAEARSAQVLDSLALTPAVVEALVRGDIEAMLVERDWVLRKLTSQFVARLAGWGRTDRPSIDQMLESAE